MYRSLAEIYAQQGQCLVSDKLGNTYNLQACNQYHALASHPSEGDITLPATMAEFKPVSDLVNHYRAILTDGVNFLLSDVLFSTSEKAKEYFGDVEGIKFIKLSNSYVELDPMEAEL